MIYYDFILLQNKHETFKNDLTLTQQFSVKANTKHFKGQ